jgi:hypothetical protein
VAGYLKTKWVAWMSRFALGIIWSLKVNKVYDEIPPLE